MFKTLSFLSISYIHQVEPCCKSEIGPPWDLISRFSGSTSYCHHLGFKAVPARQSSFMFCKEVFYLSCSARLILAFYAHKVAPMFFIYPARWILYIAPILEGVDSLPRGANSVPRGVHLTFAFEVLTPFLNSLALDLPPPLRP